MSENNANKTKGKKNIVKIIVAILSLLAAIYGGYSIQNLYIRSQVANITGDGNTVNINSIDDLVNNHNKMLEENETLEKQNKDYFEQIQELEKAIKDLEEQSDNAPSIELKDLGLCIDGDNININNQNSYAIIDGREYFARDFIDVLKDNDKSIAIKDNALYIGRIISEKEDLFAQNILHSKGYEHRSSATDILGKEHINVYQFSSDMSDSYVIYTLEKNYSLLKFKISLVSYSSMDKKGKISVIADDKTVFTSDMISKNDAKEYEYNDISINNCSLLKIEYKGDKECYPIIYDACIYN